MSADEEPDRRLVNKDLIWSATTEGISDAQLQAMRMRKMNAIRPIPSRTALGHDHLMADADRTALLAEVDRLREQVARVEHANAVLVEGTIIAVEAKEALRLDGERERESRRIVDAGFRELWDLKEQLETDNANLKAHLAEIRKTLNKAGAHGQPEACGVWQMARANAALREALEQAEELLEEGEASDGHHTHNELYRFRMVLHAFAVRAWVGDGYEVVKSRLHHDGERPFGGGWFIVVAQLPTGQVSNHYKDEFWDLFDLCETDVAPVWDGHSAEEAFERMLAALAVLPPAR